MMTKAVTEVIQHEGIINETKIKSINPEDTWDILSWPEPPILSKAKIIIQLNNEPVQNQSSSLPPLTPHPNPYTQTSQTQTQQEQTQTQANNTTKPSNQQPHDSPPPPPKTDGPSPNTIGALSSILSNGLDINSIISLLGKDNNGILGNISKLMPLIQPLLQNFGTTKKTTTVEERVINLDNYTRIK